MTSIENNENQPAPPSREQILEIALRDATVHQSVQLWKQGAMSWEAAMM
jgi:hypothetical protein